MWPAISLLLPGLVVLVGSLRGDPSALNALLEDVQSSASRPSALHADEAKCPLFPQADVEVMKQRMQHGPVFTRSPTPDKSKGHVHLFIICWPYQGSTALMNLIASSPEASTLCKLQGHVCCEGQDLLYEAGLLPDLQWKTVSTSLHQPKDWNEAVGAYAKVWNMSKSVLLDKTPGIHVKVPKIYLDLLQQGKRAKFLLMTRSPCDDKVRSQGKNERLATMQASTAVPDDHVLHIRYEDLVRDPYRQSQRIVDFVPELGSVDPSVSALSWKIGGDRGVALADYAVKSGARDQPQPIITTFPHEWMEYAQHFGYA